MSQLQSLFSAQCKVATYSATTSAPSAAALQSAGNSARICNEGVVAAFVAISAVNDTTAIASLPSNGVTTACFVGPGADITVSIPASSVCYASAITRSGSATVNIYVGEGV